MSSENLQRTDLKRLFASRKNSFTLKMAPMIDIIFLLLIFFLVAAKWKPPEDFLPFKIPTAHAQQGYSIKPEPLLIYINPAQNGCEIQIGHISKVTIRDESIEKDLAAMMDELLLCLERQKRFASDPIEIICEAKVKWDYFAKTYNLLYGSGLTDITFLMTE